MKTLADYFQNVCIAYLLSGVSVSSLGAEVSRIIFQTAHLGQAYDCYTVDVELGGQIAFAVLRHDLPPFVPLTKIVDECISAPSKNGVECFIWTVYKYLHAYVSRRQEAMMLKVKIWPLADWIDNLLISRTTCPSVETVLYYNLQFFPNQYICP